MNFNIEKMQGLIQSVIVMGISLCFLAACNNDQNSNKEETLRYFRFQSCPENGHGHWQDSSFVAATANPVVIQQCLDELNLPFASRKLFPLGEIKNGSGGYNKNATHSFNWHFIEDNWQLVELGIEIYDGCPYSVVELRGFVNSLGSYGGWSNRIVEEVKVP